MKEIDTTSDHGRVFTEWPDDTQLLVVMAADEIAEAIAQYRANGRPD